MKHILLTIFLSCSIVYSSVCQIKIVNYSDGVVHYSKTDSTNVSSSFYQILEDVQEFFIPSNKPFDKTIAFLIGISQYENFQSLPKVPEDIAKLKEFFLNDGGVDEVYVAQDKIVTPELIRYYMTSYLPEKLNENDRLIFYFSGHGDDNAGHTGYMQCSNAESEVFYKNVVAINESIEWSEVIPAKHILFLFDCCSSGFAFNNKGPTDEMDKILSTLSGDGSRVFITAGDKDQKTYDGWFTNAFLKSFTNTSDIFISSTDIYSTIQKEIAIQSAIHKKKLSPRMWEYGDNNGTFLFINPKKNNSIPTVYRAYLKTDSKGNITPDNSEAFRLLQSVLSKVNKQLIVFDSITSINDYEPNWLYEILNFEITKSLNNNKNYIIVPSHILSSGNLNYHLPKLALQIDTITQKRVEVTDGYGGTNAAYQVSCQLNIHILSNGSIHHLNLDLQSQKETKYQALIALYRSAIFNLDIFLQNEFVTQKTKFFKSTANRFYLNKGKKHHIEKFQLMFALDNKNQKKRSLLSISSVSDTSSIAVPLIGKRNIEPDDYFIQALYPPHSRVYQYFINYGILPVNYETNPIYTYNNFNKETRVFDVGIKIKDKRYLWQNYGEIYLGAALKGFSGLLGGINMGVSHDVLKGYLTVNGSFGIGFASLDYNLTDQMKDSIVLYHGPLENWELEDHISSNTYFIGFQTSLEYLFDSRERFQLSVTCGYKMSGNFQKFKSTYYTGKNTGAYGSTSYDDQISIIVPYELQPVQNLSINDFFIKIGIGYNSHNF